MFFEAKLGKKHAKKRVKWKDGKTGQPTKELDDCNKKQKHDSQVGRKMAANQRRKEA